MSWENSASGAHRRKLRAILQLQEHVYEELDLIVRRKKIPDRVRAAQTAALNAQVWAVDEMLFAFVTGGPANQPKPPPQDPDAKPQP